MLTYKSALLILTFLIFSPTFSSLFALQPDQVLVLYNADWREDLPGTAPGQDSLEVAQYYIARHTDPTTGKRPYLLGLHCVHRWQHHLNSPLLKEKSNDNWGGVVHKTRRLKDNKFLLDSRFVVFEIKDPEHKADWDTLKIEIVSKENLFPKITVVENGFPTGVTKVFLKETPDYTRLMAFNAAEIASGIIEVRFSVKGRDGKIFKNIKQTYYDIREFVASKTGPDGIRDDIHYLKDIENQVKAFLEDPKNALPDGILLKDHILAIVVCYGLPRVVKTTYGIARGITHDLHNHGIWSSLEQRLALMYYRVDEVMELKRLGVFKANSKKEVKPYLIRTGMVRPMYGQWVNPYMHPLAFSKKPKIEAWPEMPHFTQEWRQRHPDKFLYIVMRIDGTTPQEAKDRIDAAVYANYFLTPAIATTSKQAEVSEETLKSSLYGVKWLKALGFKYAYKGNEKFKGTGYGRVIIFNLLGPRPPFFNKISVYLPGGIAHRVISNNGWKPNTAFYRMLKRGVTFTGGVGRVYQGAPHTTSASWWDDAILFHYLFNGYCLGEAYQMSSVFLNWITSVIGDPLYCPDLTKTHIDTTPPQPLKTKIKIFPGKDRKTRKALFSCMLKQSPNIPEVAQLKLTYWRKDTTPQTVVSSVFSANPQVWIDGLQRKTTYLYKFQLIDPYGNLFESGEKSFNTNLPH